MSISPPFLGMIGATVARPAISLGAPYAVATGAGLADLYEEQYKEHPVYGLTTYKHKPRKGPKSRVKKKGTKKIFTKSKMPTGKSAKFFIVASKGSKSGGSSKSKGTNRKNKKPPSKSPKTSLTAKVNKISKQLNSSMAHHTYKALVSGRALAGIGSANHVNANVNTLSNMETYGGNLRYFDSTSGAMESVGVGTGTYSRDFNYKYVFSKIEVANNYQVPVKVKVYVCSVKGQTANDPVTLLGAGDQVLTGADITDPLVYLTELETVTQQWNVDCVIDKYLHPSQVATASHSVKDIKYDPAHADSESATYQSTFKSFVWVIRVEGPLGHDTVADQQTTLQAGVDYQYSMIAKIEYEAGANVNDIYTVDSRDATFTNAGVVSSKPVSDNISYSVA